MPENRTNEQRRADGLATLGRMSGSDDPAARAAQMEGSMGALGSYVLDMVMSDLWTQEDSLSRRDRSLATVAVLTAINLADQLAFHARAGLNHGLTREEIAEAVLHMSGYAGFSRASRAMTVLGQIYAELDGGEQGAPPLPAIPPAEAKTGEQRRLDGLAMLARLQGRDPAEVPADALTRTMGSVGALAVDYAFGEIWSRPGLSLRDRSLIVVAALIAMGRPEELKFHYPAALRNGLTYDELDALTGWIAILAGIPVSVEAMRVLTPLREEAGA